jgi:hypothetical protein
LSSLTFSHFVFSCKVFSSFTSSHALHDCMKKISHHTLMHTHQC